MWSSFAGFSSAANAFNAAGQCGRLGFCRGASTHVENPQLVFPNAGVVPGGEAAESEEWEEVDLYREANWYPDAVEKYAKGNSTAGLEEKIRMHLACLGWMIELNKASIAGLPKFRYTTPTRDRFYHSLAEVCQILVPAEGHDDDYEEEEDDDYEDYDYDYEEEVVNYQQVPIVGDGVEEEEKKKVESGRRRQQKQQLSKLNEEAKHNPEAVIEWIGCWGRGRSQDKDKSGEVALRAKKHLLSLGWDLFHIDKSCSKSAGGRRPELRYRPPPPFNSKAHISLLDACNFLVKQGLINFEDVVNKDADLMAKVEIQCQSQAVPVPKRKNLVARDALGKRIQASHVNGKNIFGIGTQRTAHFKKYGSSRMGKRNQVIKGFHVTGFGHGADDEARMGKRNQGNGFSESKVQGASSQTMTGSLIDSSLVEAMAPVYYRSRKGDAKLKEGWVTREGIKCKCCNEVFNLTRFEAHAGSTNHRPAANIILQDGRSLVQLQAQLKGRL